MKKWSLTGLLLLLTAAVLQGLARFGSEFGQWYASHIYPILVTIVARVWSVFPFSVTEWMVYLAAVSFLVALVVLRRKLVAKAGIFLFLFGLLAFLYTAQCGVNYYRRPFSSYLSLEVRASSAEELKNLCSYLTDQVNQQRQTLSPEDLSYTNSWREEGRTAMKKMAEEYPCLAGYYPLPKPLTISRILSVQQLAGVYSPFTVEANFNREMTGYNIPHTICHELSHLRGFMREDEANYIGYLACIGSDSEVFRYSGYLMGWIYANNALEKIDSQASQNFYRELSLEVQSDLEANNRFWNRFEGKAAEASAKINDTYLKINDQKDGIQSYGRAVDLLLAYYRDKL